MARVVVVRAWSGSGPAVGAPLRGNFRVRLRLIQIQRSGSWSPGPRVDRLPACAPASPLNVRVRRAPPTHVQAQVNRVAPSGYFFCFLEGGLLGVPMSRMSHGDWRCRPPRRRGLWLMLSPTRAAMTLRAHAPRSLYHHRGNFCQLPMFTAESERFHMSVDSQRQGQLRSPCFSQPCDACFSDAFSRHPVHPCEPCPQTCGGS